MIRPFFLMSIIALLSFSLVFIRRKVLILIVAITIFFLTIIVTILLQHSDQELKATIKSQQTEIESLKEYAFVKQVDITGSLCMTPTADFCVSTSISGMMREVVAENEKKDGKYQYDCSEKGITKLKEITNLYPLFPFSYFFLYECKGDQFYKDTAIEHLKKIVQIEGHLEVHDEILKTLQED